MKVYELMNELSKMKSGAEVKFSTLLTVDELIKREEFDTDEYVYTETITGIDAGDDDEVYLGC